MTPWLRMLGRDRVLTEASSKRGAAKRGQSPARDQDVDLVGKDPDQKSDTSDSRVRELRRRLKKVEPETKSKKKQEPQIPWEEPNSDENDQHWI